MTRRMLKAREAPAADGLQLVQCRVDGGLVSSAHAQVVETEEGAEARSVA
jgi:hypothetical protein